MPGINKCSPVIKDQKPDKAFKWSASFQSLSEETTIPQRQLFSRGLSEQISVVGRIYELGGAWVYKHKSPVSALSAIALQRAAASTV